jgi:hypothetical protein
MMMGGAMVVMTVAYLPKMTFMHRPLHAAPLSHIKMSALHTTQSRFFAVCHTFRPEVPRDEWWAAMADANVEKIAMRVHAKGLYNHCLLPVERGNRMISLWESKQTTTPREVEAALDAPDGPFGDWGALVSRAHLVMKGAILPPSAWPTESAHRSAPSSGSTFLVQFRRRPGNDDITTWRKHSGLPGHLFSPHPTQLHNAMFLPVDNEGSIYCVWETREQMSETEFAHFLEGPNCPVPYSAYQYEAHEVDSSRLTRLPASAFQRRAAGFMASSMMPMMDGAMNNLFGSLAHLASAAKTNDAPRPDLVFAQPVSADEVRELRLEELKEALEKEAMAIAEIEAEIDLEEAEIDSEFFGTVDQLDAVEMEKVREAMPFHVDVPLRRKASVKVCKQDYAGDKADIADGEFDA